MRRTQAYFAAYTQQHQITELAVGVGEGVAEGGGLGATGDSEIERARDPRAGKPVATRKSGHTPAVVGGRTRTPRGKIPQHATPAQHVIVWLIGVLLASLIPLLFLYFHGLDSSHAPTVFDLLGHGDLLLISLVVTIAAITELVLAVNNIQQAQLLPTAVILLGAVLAVAAEALWYADISAQLLDGQSFGSTHVVTYGSLIFFGLSAYCSSMCVKLAAGTR